MTIHEFGVKKLRDKTPIMAIQAVVGLWAMNSENHILNESKTDARNGGARAFVLATRIPTVMKMSPHKPNYVRFR